MKKYHHVHWICESEICGIDSLSKKRNVSWLRNGESLLHFVAWLPDSFEDCVHFCSGVLFWKKRELCSLRFYHDDGGDILKTTLLVLSEVENIDAASSYSKWWLWQTMDEATTSHCLPEEQLHWQKRRKQRPRVLLEPLP